MNANQESLVVTARIQITAAALQAIVKNAKHLSGKNEKGHYAVDTAAKVDEMISKFLHEKGFEAYVEDLANYP